MGTELLGAGPVPSFRNDIQPVLTKLGCNSGACHGSQYGKGGFKLSLLGFDAQADYDAIVKDLRGRRVDLESPAESLILLKPTLALPVIAENLIRAENTGVAPIGEIITFSASVPFSSHFSRSSSPRFEPGWPSKLRLRLYVTRSPCFNAAHQRCLRLKQSDQFF